MTKIFGQPVLVGSERTSASQSLGAASNTEPGPRNERIQVKVTVVGSNKPRGQYLVFTLVIKKDNLVIKYQNFSLNESGMSLHALWV